MSLDITPFPTIETQAGLNLATRENGFVIAIDAMSVGDGAWAPDRRATALKNEILRVPISRAEITDAGEITTQALITAPRTFDLREIGFWSGETLVYIGVNDDSANFARLSAGMSLGLAHTHHLSFLPNDQITVNCSGPDMNMVFDAEFMTFCAAITSLQAKYLTQLEQIAALRDEIAKQRARIAQLQQQIAALRDESAALRDEIAKQRAQIAQLQQQTGHLARAQVDTQLCHAAAITSLQNQELKRILK